MKLVLGLGCDRGASAQAIMAAVRLALASVDASLHDVIAAASIDKKSDEAGMLHVCEKHGWPLTFYPATQLCTVAVPNPSAVVMRYMATPSVGEAAAILCANSDQEHLMVEKFKYRSPDDGKHVTVSVCVTA
ncbi:MAG: cobalamin biosynthesis protein [Mariprofundaceae bacterium]|nr:cobalamin biosynthesis protein [Mariprofundaceae bacterium]